MYLLIIDLLNSFFYFRFILDFYNFINSPEVFSVTRNYKLLLVYLVSEGLEHIFNTFKSCRHPILFLSGFFWGDILTKMLYDYFQTLFVCIHVMN